MLRPLLRAHLDGCSEDNSEGVPDYGSEVAVSPLRRNRRINVERPIELQTEKNIKKLKSHTMFEK